MQYLDSSSCSHDQPSAWHSQCQQRKAFEGFHKASSCPVRSVAGWRKLTTSQRHHRKGPISADPLSSRLASPAAQTIVRLKQEPEMTVPRNSPTSLLYASHHLARPHLHASDLQQLGSSAARREADRTRRHPRASTITPEILCLERLDEPVGKPDGGIP